MTNGPLQTDAADPPPGAAASAEPLGWTTLAEGQDGGRARDIPRLRQIVVQLVTAAVAVFVAVAVGATIAASRLAEREAVYDAASTTDLLAEAVVQPVITDSLLDGDAASVTALDQVVRRNVLPRGIVRVKLWTPAGRVVYADESRLIGQTFALGQEQLESLRTASVHAEVSELTASENEFERFEGKLVEVYRPVWTPSGKQLLFEVYGEYAPVRKRANALWQGLAGLLASSLILLLVLMAPVLWRVLDRLRSAQRQREKLLQRAVDASDQERRRIAATLHDGPVQELVASSFAVSGAAERAGAAGQPGLADDIRAAATTVRGSIASLRSLLVDIYPANLAQAGLDAALGDLANPLRARGTTVAIDVAPGLDLDEESSRLVYRVARECLRNVAKHAGATSTTVSLQRDETLPGIPVVLDILDDGAGFDVEGTVQHPEPGHLGLAILADIAREGRADLQVATAPGRGTHWRLVLPHQGDPR